MISKWCFAVFGYVTRLPASTPDSQALRLQILMQCQLEAPSWSSTWLVVGLAASVQPLPRWPVACFPPSGELAILEWRYSPRWLYVNDDTCIVCRACIHITAEAVAMLWGRRPDGAEIRMWPPGWAIATPIAWNSLPGPVRRLNVTEAIFREVTLHFKNL